MCVCLIHSLSGGWYDDPTQGKQDLSLLIPPSHSSLSSHPPTYFPQAPGHSRPRNPPQARKRAVLLFLFFVSFLRPSLPPSLFRHQDTRRSRTRATHLVPPHACFKGYLRARHGRQGRSLRISTRHHDASFSSVALATKA